MNNFFKILPLKVGITGGIGSGKSTICRIFNRVYGIPIYDADSMAKWLMNNDLELIRALKNAFGELLYTTDLNGAVVLNKPYLSDLVFSNADALKKLNSIVHPAVARHSEKWFFAQKNVPYTIKEAALLIESGSYKKLDALIGVTAPENIRIQRTMLRDNATEEQVRARIASQMPDAEKMSFCDYIIQNNGIDSVLEQIYFIHLQLVRKTNSVFKA